MALLCCRVVALWTPTNALAVILIAAGCARTVTPAWQGTSDVGDVGDRAEVTDAEGSDSIDGQPDVACTRATEAMCEGGCRDLSIDPANCGACRHTCGWGCMAGACDDAVELSAGYEHTCARRASGSVVCWGLNNNGQLGDGTTTHHLTPVAVAGLTDAVEIAAGGYYTCARRCSGTVVCWGDNTWGQLGDGTATQHLAPVAVEGLTDAVEITSGGAHTCARRVSGTVVCWGKNSEGQLGDGTCCDFTSHSETPAPVVGLTDAVEIAAGSEHTCARRASGAVVCWGLNFSGELGDGASGGIGLSPVTVDGLNDAVELAAATGGIHTCARRASGTVVCWGDNTAGQLGDGTSRINRLVPVLVSELVDAVEVSAGVADTCARRVSGAVVCWGWNGQGEIGDGTFGTDRFTPVAVTGLNDAVEVSVGGDHACARRRSGAVVGWGFNDSGQIGDGTSGNNRLTPVPVVAP